MHGPSIRVHRAEIGPALLLCRGQLVIGRRRGGEERLAAAVFWYFHDVVSHVREYVLHLGGIWYFHDVVLSHVREIAKTDLPPGDVTM